MWLVGSGSTERPAAGEELGGGELFGGAAQGAVAAGVTEAPKKEKSAKKKKIGLLPGEEVAGVAWPAAIGEKRVRKSSAEGPDDFAGEEHQFTSTSVNLQVTDPSISNYREEDGDGS